MKLKWGSSYTFIEHKMEDKQVCLTLTTGNIALPKFLKVPLGMITQT